MNSLVIHLFLAFFFISSIINSNFKYTFKNFTTSLNQKLLSKYLILIIPVFLLLVFSLIHSPLTLLRYFYFFAFSYLLLIYAYWVSIGFEIKLKILIITFAVILIMLRYFNSSYLIHDLFIITSLSWLGNFLVTTRILNLRRFVFISVIWLIYDITYVWLTASAQIINMKSQAAFFPLGIAYNTSLIGTGDLLFATMFMNVLPTNKSKVISAALLFTSSALLTIVAVLNNKFEIYPLLTLWVPIALIQVKKQIKSV